MSDRSDRVGDAVDRQVCDPRGHGEADARAMRWSAHRRARRAELVEAAVRAVDRHGPQVGMDEIAAEAGVTKPVLYRQFTDKSDLHIAVGQRAAATLIAAIERELAVDRAPREQAAAVVNAFLAAIEAAPQLYRFVARGPTAESRAASAMSAAPADDYATLVSTRLAALLRTALRERGRDASGAEAWARGLFGMAQATGEWWLERRSMSRPALADHLTSLIWAGLAALLEDGASASSAPPSAPALPAARRGQDRQSPPATLS